MIRPAFGAARQGPVDSELARLVEDYLADCQARRLRPQTVEQHYRPDLTDFITWAAAAGVDRVDQLTTPVVNRYTIHLQGRVRRHDGRPWSAQTVKNHVEHVNTWLRWLREQAEVLDQVVAGRRPRVPERHVEVLTDDEVKRMLEAAAKQQAGVRNHLIISLLNETGIRVGEAAWLRLDDVVVAGRERSLLVRAKEHGGGSKSPRDRLVPIPRLYPKVQAYIAKHRRQAVSDRLFLSSHLDPLTREYEPLTEEGIQWVVSIAALEAGIGRRVHPHLFRHTFATRCLEADMNPITLAKILGHKDLKQLYRTYAHVGSLARQDQLLAVLTTGKK